MAKILELKTELGTQAIKFERTINLNGAVAMLPDRNNTEQKMLQAMLTRHNQDPLAKLTVDGKEFKLLFQ